jgi:hypothetical protein
MREDFYAITFISFVYLDDPREIKGIEDEKELMDKVLSESEVQRVFLNCIFIFIIQMTLTYSCLASILYHKQENDNEKDPSKIAEIKKNELLKISF